MLVKLLFVHWRKGFQVASKVIIFLNDAFVNFSRSFRCSSKTIVPKPLNSFVWKEGLQVAKTWSRTKNLIHLVHEVLVNLDAEVSSDFFVLLGVKNEFEENLLVQLKDVARDIKTCLIASVQSEEFPHFSPKRVGLPVVVSLAERVFEFLLELLPEVPQELLHECVSPERALSIKMLRDFKSCCLGTARARCFRTWKV